MDIKTKLKDFLTKLQNLSDDKKKIILWTTVGFLAVIMGIFWIRGAMDKLSKLDISAENIQSINQNDNK
jgi:hypothetical protein